MLAKSVREERPSPKLIEFNCRFGDPEAMNVLPILTEETDIADICMRITEGSLKRKHVSFQQKATVCKYLVPSNYPEAPTAGQAISLDEQSVVSKGAQLFYASVDLIGGRVVTTGSRAIGLVGISDTIEAAERIVETATAHVNGPLRHRRDIGTARLLQRRIDHMKHIGASVPIAKEAQVGIA
jgi:phosphoribosylamine--glycine ligase